MTRLDEGPRANFTKMHIPMPKLPMERHVLASGFGWGHEHSMATSRWLSTTAATGMLSMLTILSVFHVWSRQFHTAVSPIAQSPALNCRVQKRSSCDFGSRRGKMRCQIDSEIVVWHVPVRSNGAVCQQKVVRCPSERHWTPGQGDCWNVLKPFHIYYSVSFQCCHDTAVITCNCWSIVGFSHACRPYQSLMVTCIQSKMFVTRVNLPAVMPFETAETCLLSRCASHSPAGGESIFGDLDSTGTTPWCGLPVSQPILGEAAARTGLESPDGNNGKKHWNSFTNLSWEKSACFMQISWSIFCFAAQFR